MGLGHERGWNGTDPLTATPVAADYVGGYAWGPTR